MSEGTEAVSSGAVSIGDISTGAISSGGIVTGVIVIGGGIGGVSVAGALRSGGYGGPVTLIEQAPLPYDRPPLSKDYLSGERTLEAIALQPATWYEEQKIDLIGSATVTALRPGEGAIEVDLSDGRTLSGEYAVLATGGRAVVPPIPGLAEGREAGRVHVLREFGDADLLRSALVPGNRLLVVGAGLIGAEAASTAGKLGCDVLVVDPMDPPLALAAGSTVARWLHDNHAKHGIQTAVALLESVQVGEDGISARLQGEDAPREFDAILVGVGMVANSELAQAAGLEVDRGVLVDERQVTSHPRVLAIGDVSRLRDGHHTEHWEAAQIDGKVAAATILGIPPAASGAHWWWSDRHGLHVEGVGSMHEPDEEYTVVLRGTLGDPPFSAFTLRGTSVVGIVAVDDPQAIRAGRRLIDRGIAVDPARLADPSTDLRKLLRGAT